MMTALNGMKTEKVLTGIECQAKPTGKNGKVNSRMNYLKAEA